MEIKSTKHEDLKAIAHAPEKCLETCSVDAFLTIKFPLNMYSKLNFPNILKQLVCTEMSFSWCCKGNSHPSEPFLTQVKHINLETPLADKPCTL